MSRFQTGLVALALATGVLLSGWACRKDKVEAKEDEAKEDLACLRSVGGLCLVTRIPGPTDGGELGFRFGPPADVDGDGIVDIAAGARFTRFVQDPDSQTGETWVWSGANQDVLKDWRGELSNGMLGHTSTLAPDLSGDGLADLITAGPTGRVPGEGIIGSLWARTVIGDRPLWTRSGEPGDSFGWDLALTQDHNGDGVGDLFVGAPGKKTGKAHLLSGRDGAILRTYTSTEEYDSFGWYVSRLGDLDGDGLDDVAIGAPITKIDGKQLSGKAYVLSSATGKTLFEWSGAHEFALMGEIVCGLPDINNDGKSDIAVSATYTDAREGPVEGLVQVYSGADGRVLHRWQGRQVRELYGRMVASAGDYDRDGVGDVAIGAPWYQAGDMSRAGRVELRSGSTGSLLVELIGDAPNQWQGWHMEPVAQVGKTGNPGLLMSLIGSNQHSGALELYEYRVQ